VAIRDEKLPRMEWMKIVFQFGARKGANGGTNRPVSNAEVQ